ncbi:MAG: hypothetical protein ACK50Q_13650 [Labrys sp. (in: a-proteobacteria)]
MPYFDARPVDAPGLSPPIMATTQRKTILVDLRALNDVGSASVQAVIDEIWTLAVRAVLLVVDGFDASDIVVPYGMRIIQGEDALDEPIAIRVRYARPSELYLGTQEEVFIHSFSGSSRFAAEASDGPPLRGIAETLRTVMGHRSGHRQDRPGRPFPRPRHTTNG